MGTANIHLLYQCLIVLLGVIQSKISICGDKSNTVNRITMKLHHIFHCLFDQANPNNRPNQIFSHCLRRPIDLITQKPPPHITRKRDMKIHLVIRVKAVGMRTWNKKNLKTKLTTKRVLVYKWQKKRKRKKRIWWKNQYKWMAMQMLNMRA